VLVGLLLALLGILALAGILALVVLVSLALDRVPDIDHLVQQLPRGLQVL